jgi:hypothetical protein
MLTDLQWYFGSGGSEHQGPNNSIMTTFKGNKYYSLAREVIQNSLDAAEPNKNLPVKVSFALAKIAVSDIPNFLALRETIQQCAVFYKDDSKFSNFCTTATRLLEADIITCLRISDYNTVGMEYRSEDEKSPFYAFMKSVGFNFKPSSGAGGSFGYGKGAYYAASQLHTLFVSGIYGDNKYIFQGKSRLTTHKDGQGNIKDYSGLYGLGNGIPVTNIEMAPEVFKRSEKGTDIIIPGFHEERDWKEALIKSILNNFWLSILEDKLVVSVGDTVIDKENIEEIISQYYTETDSDGGIHEPETWNPYPYFKAVKYVGGAYSQRFQEHLSTLGLVQLYLLQKDGLPNRTVYMRSPKMTVFKKTDNRGFSYAGVFVCDNVEGNAILRQMENPQHNEWKKNNYLENDAVHLDAKKAEDEIKAFVKKCLERLMTTATEKSQRITGLENYLNIPEDLLPENEGNGNTTTGSRISAQFTEEETGSETTRKQGEGRVALAVKKSVSVVAYTAGESVPEGENPSLVGADGTTEGQGHTGNGNENAEGNNFGESRAPADETAPAKVKIPYSIRYRVIAQVDKTEGILHLLKIFSSKDTTADIELFAGLDNESDSADNMLTIASAKINEARLSVKDNKIKSIPLIAGWNLLYVRFDSNQKHALKLRSYEV